MGGNINDLILAKITILVHTSHTKFEKKCPNCELTDVDDANSLIFKNYHFCRPIENIQQRHVFR